VRCYSADVDVYAIEDVYDHDMLGVVPLPVVVGVVPDVGVVPVGVAGVGVAAGGSGTSNFKHVCNTAARALSGNQLRTHNLKLQTLPSP